MNITNTLKQMIADQSKKLNSLDHNHKFHLSSPAYNREFKTVGLILPRMTGKTHAIVEMSLPNDLIVTHNERMEDELRYLTHGNVEVKSATKFNPYEFAGIRNRKYGYVFIDEAFLIERKYIDGMYSYVDADWFVALTTM